jgi:hypothetical protein
MRTGNGERLEVLRIGIAERAFLLARSEKKKPGEHFGLPG